MSSSRSDPKAKPKIILSDPATIEITLLALFVDSFSDFENGSAITIVIMPIAAIVPMEKSIKNKKPVKKDGLVGSIAIITAALPARPCITPIENDFKRKNDRNIPVS